MTEIATWLIKFDLGQYAPNFERNDIDLTIVRTLNEDDLRELGVVVIGHRKRILIEIEALRQTEETAEGPERRAERRHITVVFCDLVGSTDLSMRLDAETLDQVMRSYVQTCNTIVRTNGGMLAQVQGDGVLIYFGYPRANEDDPERAVRTAFELVREVSKIDVIDERLQVRIGMATGMVVVGTHWHRIVSDTTIVVGETPNVAARIQTLAKPGEILISDSTRRRLGGRVQVEDRGAYELRGVNRSVRVWRAMDIGVSANRFVESREALGLTPLVGRKDDLAKLAEIWAKVSSGTGQTVLLRGEAGIGKSRLARSFVKSLKHSEASIVTFQCSPTHMNSPLSPIMHHIEAEAGIATGDPADLRIDKLSKVLPHRDEADQHARTLDAFFDRSGERLSDGPDASPEKRRVAAFRAITDYLLGMTCTGPEVLLLEDLHWADPTTNTFFKEFSSRLSSHPILLLLTSRIRAPKDWPSDAPFSELTVEPLESRHSRTLCLSLSEGRLSADLYDSIVQKGDGNPLFLEELTKAVQATTTSNDNNLRVPDSLRDPLMARIDQLGDAAKLARVGAVIGREFELQDVRQLAQIDDAELLSSLDTLLASELVLPVAIGAEKTFRFKHALVQDAAYDSLLQLEKRPLHHRYAKMLSERGDGVVPELIATHFDLAGHALEAGQNWYKAGLNALSNSANVEALRHIQSGISAIAEVISGDERRELEGDLQIALGAAYRAVEGFASPYVEASFSRAMQIIGSENVGAQLLDCHRGLNSCFYIRGDLKNSIDLSRRVIGQGCTRSNVSFEMMGRYMYGSSLFWQGSYDLAKSELSGSIDLSSRLRGHSDKLSSQINPIAYAKLHLGWTLWCLGKSDEGRAQIDETLDFAQTLRQPFTMAMALLWTSWLGLSDRRAEGIAGQVKSLAALSEEQGYGYLRIWADALSGVVEISDGEGRRGVEQVLNGIRLLEKQGAHLGLGWLQFWAGYGLHCDGRLEECRFQLEEALRKMQRSGSYHWAPQTHYLMAKVVGHLPGGAKSSRRHLRTAMDLARKQGAAQFLLSLTDGVETADAVAKTPEY